MIAVDEQEIDPLGPGRSCHLRCRHHDVDVGKGLGRKRLASICELGRWISEISVQSTILQETKCRKSKS